MVGWLRGLRRAVANRLGALSPRPAGSNPAPTVDVAVLMAEFESREMRRLQPKPRYQPRTTKPRSKAGSCPTPGKVSYGSLSSAKASRQWRANKGMRMRVYRCPCGSYHLARKDVAA